ncbi:MAG: MmcQ/YjbR family DNA-binding protein [Saccharofermentans sp.]|nr:MmcQ/YjbR family DNA-binding protein [Saccharofermentans sp.]
MTSLRKKVIEYIKKKYNASPEFLWKRYPDYAVFRHDDNRKWFAVIMSVDADKLGVMGTGRVDIVDVKINDMVFRDILLQQEGYLSAYHMNKQNWITIRLDGSVDPDQVFRMIDESFQNTASNMKKKKFRQPKEWIIPANPKYYDVEAAFRANEEIDWKQGAGIIKGDTVFMYVGAPVSAVLYKCKVTEVDIPYDYEDDNLRITALMKIRLLKRYKRDEFTFERLKSEYGIFAVRGPRGIPYSLSEALK